jgi:hypothetical protein
LLSWRSKAFTPTEVTLSASCSSADSSRCTAGPTMYSRLGVSRSAFRVTNCPTSDSPLPSLQKVTGASEQSGESCRPHVNSSLKVWLSTVAWAIALERVGCRR